MPKDVASKNGTRRCRFYCKAADYLRCAFTFKRQA